MSASLLTLVGDCAQCPLRSPGRKHVCLHPEVAHLKMKEAMWKVDPDGDFRFSDATNPNQLVLFEADTTPPLVGELRKEFCGKGQVTGFTVRAFVENKTAYLKKHMTAALKQEEDASRIRVDALKADGKKRRANSYPDEVKLAWV